MTTERYLPEGFSFAGIAAGLKKSGKPDVAVVQSSIPCPTAAVFTQNRFAAAPVHVSKHALAQNGGTAQFVITNSGNANAGTGEQGMTAAQDMVAAGAKALGIDAALGLVASTGVIGVQLDMDIVRSGITSASGKMESSLEAFDKFAHAILTTDKRAKISSETTEDGAVSFIGCTKGAGMIMPNMATTLSYVFTDGQTTPEVLREALQWATDRTYNRLTIDGDTSTNDMILVMASGSKRQVDKDELSKHVQSILADLAHQLMADGEGVNHVVTVNVNGAQDDDKANQIAKTVANSSLVKAAIHGCDPNWGRILCATGNAGIEVEESTLEIKIEDHVLFAEGQPTGFDEAAVSDTMNQATYDIFITVGNGQGSSHYLACDLSKDYVRINADYRT